MLERGERPEIPLYLKEIALSDKRVEKLLEITTLCWSQNSSDRPTATMIFKNLVVDGYNSDMTELKKMSGQPISRFKTVHYIYMIFPILLSRSQLK
jgi:hypothetical protein